MDIQAIKDAALHLPIDARADLAKQLLQSLDHPSKSECNQLWAEEAVRRAKEIDTETVTLTASNDVSAVALKLLKQNLPS